MVIERGQVWGEPGGLPVGAPVVRSDADLAEILAGGERPALVGVLGGDLCRTLGGPRTDERLRSPEAFRMPVDCGWVALDDGPERPFAAHVIARRRWWRGRIVAVMNAQFRGDADVAPRSHPNDGRLDVVDVDAAMPARQRWKARQRLTSGTHVPHPLITERRVVAWAAEFADPMEVHVDGRRVGRAIRLAVRCEADAVVVVA